MTLAFCCIQTHTPVRLKILLSELKVTNFYLLMSPVASKGGIYQNTNQALLALHLRQLLAFVSLLQKMMAQS